MAAFPDVAALAAADRRAFWGSGRVEPCQRARNLQAAAKAIRERHGAFPRTVADLRGCPA
jgi:adenine-specific DNA glycosylase